VLIGHLQQAPPPPRSLKPETPEAYEAIILKCLEKRQEDRFQSMKELKLAIEALMDQLGISRELPKADETDPEMQAVESRPSNPGQRTPGRPTGPGPSKNRISNPNARAGKPGVRTSNPNVRGSNPNALAKRPGTRPGQSQPPSMPPEPSRTGLFAGLAAAAVLVIGVVAFILVRSANQRTETVSQAATVKAAKIAAAAAKNVEEDTSPVFLSVISEPLEADVTATWKDGGEKKGQAPLSFEVPKNTKVHFEFSKGGYIGYSMDVIADQAQNVHAVLKSAPVAVENVEKRPKKGKKENGEKKPETAPSKDGLIDLDDALK
jgi:hypothetical protein